MIYSFTDIQLTSPSMGYRSPRGTSQRSRHLNSQEEYLGINQRRDLKDCCVKKAV